MCKSKYIGIITLVLLVHTIVIGGCGQIYDDYSCCPKPFMLYLKFIDSNGNDITSTNVFENTEIFVFTKEGKYVDKIKVKGDNINKRVPIEIRYNNHKQLKFIVWGGIKSTRSLSLKDTYIKLKSEEGVATSPNDLFYGKEIIDIEFGKYEYSKEQTIIFRRITSSVVILAKNLKNMYPQTNTEDFSFLLKYSLDSYNINGDIIGDKISYKPNMNKSDNGDIISSIFRTIPTRDNESYTVEIYHKGNLIGSFNKDSKGNNFIPKVGKLLNIILDFKNLLSIKVVLTPWDEVYQEVDY